MWRHGCWGRQALRLLPEDVVSLGGPGPWRPGLWVWPWQGERSSGGLWLL